METSGRQTVEYKTPFYIMVKRFSCPLMMHHNVFLLYVLLTSLTFLQKRIFVCPYIKLIYLIWFELLLTVWILNLIISRKSGNPFSLRNLLDIFVWYTKYKRSVLDKTNKLWNAHNSQKVYLRILVLNKEHVKRFKSFCV